jgi:hypothetical protein
MSTNRPNAHVLLKQRKLVTNAPPTLCIVYIIVIEREWCIVYIIVIERGWCIVYIIFIERGWCIVYIIVIERGWCIGNEFPLLMR